MTNKQWVSFSQLSILDILKVLFVSGLIGLALAWAVIGKWGL
jgi:hypothetical protein